MQTVIFDCDGVLLDTESAMAEIWVDVLSRLGAAVSIEGYIGQFTGLSGAEQLTTLRESGIELSQGDLSEIADRERAALGGITAIPGMIQLIASLETPCCVASSSSPERLAATLGQNGLLAFFEGRVFSATMVKRGKPAPDLFLFAARAMGATPDECLVVEDSVHGVQAAQAAGMTVIGFTGASHMYPSVVERLRAAGPHLLAGNAAELRAMLPR